MIAIILPPRRVKRKNLDQLQIDPIEIFGAIQLDPQFPVN